MQPTDLYQQFIQDIYTKPSVLRRLRLLKEFVDFKSFAGGKDKTISVALSEFSKLATSNAISPLDLSWLEHLPVDFLTAVSSSPDWIKKFEGQIATHQIITIYLPFEITEKELTQIGQWLKQNISPLAIFEESFNENLIGGASLSYKGVIKDYSLKSRIEANKDVVIKSLSAFGHS